MVRTLRSTVALSVAIVTLTFGWFVAPVPANGAESMPAFYTPPDILPAGEGTPIRAEFMTFYLDPLHVVEAPAIATRIMYTSTDRVGQPVAITGTLLQPYAPWFGSGPRPIIGYAPGTQGLGDCCAPSYQGSNGWEYEGLFISRLLARGYTVVMPDYNGLGTPGEHTYMIREDQGHAVLDAVRAALTLTDAAVTTPVGLSGYSQGGGAAAAAAELAATYAPDIALKGTAAGAVPADLAEVGEFLDGGLYSMYGLYSLSAMQVSYNTDVSQFATFEAELLLDAARDTCVYDLLLFAFLRLEDYTIDGQGPEVWFAREPYRTIFADNRIGNRRPTGKVLVFHSVLDEVIPYTIGRQLARDWRALGADVQFRPSFTPTHVGAATEFSPLALDFFQRVFSTSRQRGSRGWFRAAPRHSKGRRR